MPRMRRLGTAIAVAGALTTVHGAGSASAANWDPANVTLTAHGTLTLDLNPLGASLTCTYHAGVRSAGGADAFTTAAGGTTPVGPTYSNCTSSLPLGALTITTSAWTLTATSTTAVDVRNPIPTIAFDTAFGQCTITPDNVSLPMTWSNVTHALTAGATVAPVTSAGAPCPDITTVGITGSIVIPGASTT